MVDAFPSANDAGQANLACHRCRLLLLQQLRTFAFVSMPQAASDSPAGMHRLRARWSVECGEEREIKGLLTVLYGTEHSSARATNQFFLASAHKVLPAGSAHRLNRSAPLWQPGAFRTIMSCRSEGNSGPRRVAMVVRQPGGRAWPLVAPFAFESPTRGQKAPLRSSRLLT